VQPFCHPALTKATSQRLYRWGQASLLFHQSTSRFLSSKKLDFGRRGASRAGKDCVARCGDLSSAGPAARPFRRRPSHPYQSHSYSPIAANTNGGGTADRYVRHDVVGCNNRSRSRSNRSRRTCSQTSRRGPMDGGRCSAVPSCDWVCIFQTVAVSNTDKTATTLVV
jgi:hypothetical protein